MSVHVHVCSCVCEFMCMCAGQKSVSGIIPVVLSMWFADSLELTDEARVTEHKAAGIHLCLPGQRMDGKHASSRLLLNRGFWEWSAGPRVCIASLLLSPLPRTKKCIFIILFISSRDTVTTPPSEQLEGIDTSG